MKMNLDLARKELELHKLISEGERELILSILRILDGYNTNGAILATLQNVIKPLIEGDPLTPLTGEDWEWREVTQYYKNLPEYYSQLFENIRYPAVVKYIYMNGSERVVDDSNHGNEVTFPYNATFTAIRNYRNTENKYDLFKMSDVFLSYHKDVENFINSLLEEKLKEVQAEPNYKERVEAVAKYRLRENDILAKFNMEDQKKNYDPVMAILDSDGNNKYNDSM